MTMLLKYMVSNFLFAVLYWCYPTELKFFISVYLRCLGQYTTKEISMKRQIFIFIVGIKLEEKIRKISLWLQCKYVSNTMGRIRCSHFDNIHTCLSSWGFHFLVAAEVIAALWCSCYPQPFLDCKWLALAGQGDLLTHSRKESSIDEISWFMRSCISRAKNHLSADMWCVC